MEIKPELGISIVFSFIGSMLFIGGLLNVLPEIAIIISGGGFLCLIFDNVRKKSKMERFKSMFSGGGGLFFLLIWIVFIIVILYDEKFLHYDNFSHWALVVKTIARNNSFPTWKDTNIAY